MNELKNICNIHIDNNNEGYFCYVIYKDEIYWSDFEIADLMGISINYYTNLMKINFGDKVKLYADQFVYISNYDDVLEVKEWLKKNIMPYIILKELNPDIVIE